MALMAAGALGILGKTSLVPNTTHALAEGLLVVFSKPVSVSLQGTPFSQSAVFSEGQAVVLSGGEVGRSDSVAINYTPEDAVLIGFRWSSTPEAIGRRLPIHVLHVSAVMENEVARAVAAAEADSFVTVEQVSLTAFNGGAPSDLTAYDVIVFGFNDGYEPGTADAFNLDRLASVRECVRAGAGCVWTHDSLEWDHDLGAVAEEPAGVDYDKDAYASGRISAIGGSSVIFGDESHPMLTFPFRISLPSGEGGLPVDSTHTTGGKTTGATVVARFAGQRLSHSNFYLTASQFGLGRVAIDEIGHSYTPWNAGTSSWPSIEECQLFVDCLLWAAGM